MRPRAISTIVVNWSYYSAVAVCHESYNMFTIALAIIHEKHTECVDLQSSTLGLDRMHASACYTSLASRQLELTIESAVHVAVCHELNIAIIYVFTIALDRISYYS